MPEPQSLREFLEWEPVFPTAMLGKGLLYAGTKAIIYGKYKSMKSMLVQRLGLSLADGQPWLGIETPESGVSVLYLQLEYPHPLLRERIKIMTKGKWKTKKPIIFWTQHYLKLDTVKGQSLLEQQLLKYRPDVLIIDPVYKVVSGNISDNHAMSTLVDYLDELIGQYNLTIVLVNHTVKPPTKEDKPTWGSDDMIGGGIFSWWGDSIIKVERGDEALRIKFEVVRHASSEMKPVVVEIDKHLQFEPKTINL